MMATDLADALVRRRVTFRDAHSAVGSLVRGAELAGVDLGELSDASFSSAHSLFTKRSRVELEPETSVSRREIPGGTGPRAVRSQLATARKTLREK